jgi:hypothetical protein
MHQMPGSVACFPTGTTNVLLGKGKFDISKQGAFRELDARL